MKKIKADLHNHFSTLENFGNIFDKAMTVAQKNLGPEGMFAVVNAQDKTEIGRYETFLQQAGSKEVKDFGNAFYFSDKNIYVIKGQEVFTEGGHILVLGLNHGVKLKDYRPLRDSFKEAEDNNGVIIADHPFFLDGIFWKGNTEEKIISKLDAIEVHNGEAWLPFPGASGANKKAQEFYNSLQGNWDIGTISTSDGHSVREIGSSYSVLVEPDFSSPERLTETLRQSIRGHKSWRNDKQTNSYLPTLNHAAKVVCLRLAAKAKLIDRIN